MSENMTLKKIRERYEDFADRYVINRLHNDTGKLLDALDDIVSLPTKTGSEIMLYDITSAYVDAKELQAILDKL